MLGTCRSHAYSLSESIPGQSQRDARIGKFANILLRPEYRFDHSNEDFFTHKRDCRSRHTQHTLGVGAVVYF